MRDRTAIGTVLTACGVLALTVLTWSRLVWTPPSERPLVAGVAAGLVLLVVAAAVWFVTRVRARQRVVGSRRPGSQLREVWADRDLREQLVRQGVWVPSVGRWYGTALTFAWSPTGLSLWHGGRAAQEVLDLPWSDIASVGGGTASTGRPALLVRTVAGADLVLVPQSRPGGGLGPAPASAVDELVVAVRRARDLAEQG